MATDDITWRFIGKTYLAQRSKATGESSGTLIARFTDALSIGGLK
jgi:hypothetical protein